MWKRSILALLLVAAVLFQTSHTVAQEPPPGTATGQKIGTIVKTALGTALPAVQPLLDLIWNKTGKGQNDKVKKDELKAAVDSARKELLSEAQKKVQPVTAVADELTTLNKFLYPSVQANANLIRIQTRFSVAGTTVSDSVWQKQNEDWGVAKAQIETMGKISTDELNKVRDLWLRNTLTKIKNSSQELNTRVDSQMKNKDVASLRDTIKDLSATLNDVATAVGYEISDLQSDLGDLAKWSSGSQSGNIPVITKDQETLKKLLDERYKH